MRPLDLQGKTFGRLTVVGRAASDARGRAFWACSCSCGASTTVAARHLAEGSIRSCGCLRSEVSSRKLTRHGHARIGRRSAEYRIWTGIKTRCTNPREPAYKDYGGRGIFICQRWADSFEDFLADMGPRPGPGYSIDRFPNNDGNYEPTNCRWATASEQARNRRPARRRSA